MSKLSGKTMLALMVCMLLAMVISTGAAMAGGEEQAQPAVVSGSYSVSTGEGMENCLTKVEDGKVSISYDEGETWEELDESELAEKGIVIEANDESLPVLEEGVETCIVVEEADGKVRMSTDGGETWQDVKNFSVETNGDAKDKVMFKTDGETHEFSTDGGDTWQQSQFSEVKETI